MSVPFRLNLSGELEAQSIQAALGASQWTLHGRRNRSFVLVNGGGAIRFGGEETALTAPSLVWIPEGDSARLTLQAGSRGAWLAISRAALGDVPLPGDIAQELSRLAGRAQLGSAIDRVSARRLCDLATMIESELREGGPGSPETIRHLLALVCIMLWRVSDLLPADPLPAPRVIVGNFLQLVDLHMRNHWNVADYARYLGVSTDRLNTAVQRATGRTPLALIHARLMLAASQMLESSGLQIAEIATQLGFEDAAYFSRFFKRLAGKSPRQYRLASMNRQAQASNSFAAWP